MWHIWLNTTTNDTTVSKGGLRFAPQNAAVKAAVNGGFAHTPHTQRAA